MFDDENYQDGFDDDALSRGLRMQLWWKLFTYTFPYRANMMWLAGFALAVAAFDVTLPLVTKWVIDEITVHGAAADLTRFIWVYLGLTALLAVSVGGFIMQAGKIRTHISHDIRRDGFDNLQRLSFAFYDYRPVGWLMARMTSDCERLSNILAWGFLDLVWGSTLMLGIAIAMLVMNVKLALVVLAVLPLLAWISVWFRRRILASARAVRRTNSRITGTYNESIMGVLTTKAFVREADNLDDFRGLSGNMYHHSTTNLIQAAVYVPLVLTLASLATGLALAMGGIELAAGAIGTGTLIAFMAYTRHFFEPVEQLGHWFAEMQMAQASAERILSLIEARPDIRDDDDVRASLTAGDGQPPRDNVAADGGHARISRIELVNVAFAYDPAKPVLQDINLAVHSGETIAIVGPTGGGKSTLVNLVCRFYEPTAGQILIDGVDYRKRSLHWLQSNLGMVLQSSHVFSGSVRENIRYGRLDASDEEVEQAARLAGAHEFITTMEDGYDTDVGESGNRLSAGQKQLLSFARAVLSDPQILVMDEATSSVDTHTEQHIQRGLANLLGGRIAFVIAHRLSTVRNADRIVVIRDGCIAELGTHAELMARRGHYFELYRQQSLAESTRELPAAATVPA